MAHIRTSNKQEWRGWELQKEVITMYDEINNKYGGKVNVKKDYNHSIDTVNAFEFDSLRTG